VNVQPNTQSNSNSDSKEVVLLQNQVK
jgi:hypothetical protein